MATLSLLAAIIACFSRLLQASEVEFKEAGEIEVDLGERLTLICSASSLYDIELLQIGEILTVEEKIAYNTSQHGNPSMHYDPEGCQRSVEAVLCSKIYSITVTGNMHGRSYQCLVSDNDDTYYSQGGYVRVRDIPTTTVVPLPSITLSSLHNNSVSCSPISAPTTPIWPPTLQATPPEAGGCQCSGAFTTHSSPLLLTVMLLHYMQQLLMNLVL